MLASKLLFVLSEGMIFGLFAYGVYIAFQWMRFPDLTPDGSFMIGAGIYVKAAYNGLNPLVCLGLAVFAGACAGLITATINRVVKIPALIAGLLTSTGLYSIGWFLLGKPNQYLEPSYTLVGDVKGMAYSSELIFWLLAIVGIVTILLMIYSNTLWGLKTKAIGENPLLAIDLHSSETLHHFLILAVSNGIIGLAGALFIQRSFTVDINMGIGQTIIGLIGMMLGLILARGRRNTLLILTCIVIGAVIYKSVIFLTLDIGMPAESFRLISALFLIVLFFIAKDSRLNLLKGLKWN